MTFPYPLELVHGSDAVKRLHELRVTASGTPLILGDQDHYDRVEENLDMSGTTVEELLEEAAAIDPLLWLQSREDEDAEYFEMDPADWPEADYPNDQLSAHLHVSTREPLPEVYLTVLPSPRAWEAACYLKIGGWNSMPFPQEHSALWRYWEDRYGAKVACIADDVIEFTVDRPPTTREDALVLARQQFIYCADIVHQGVGNLESLASTLLNAPVWYFWWD